MERRSFLVGAGALGLTALLAACASPAVTAAGQVAFFNDVPTWTPGFDSANTVLKSLARATLAPRSVPGSSSYQQVIQSQLQTTNPPDLAKWGSGYTLQDLARTGRLQPLDDAWKKSIDNGWVPASLRSNFDYRGATYGLPLQQGYYIMFYNAALFEKLDLQAPSTWAEFLTVCETLKKHGVTPMGTTQVNSWPASIWMSVLAAAFDPDWYQKVCRNEASYLDEAGKDFMNLWQEMIQKNWFTSADTSYDDMPALLQKQAIGMYAGAVSWSSQSIDVTGLKPTTGYDTFVLPAVKTPKPTAIITEVAGLIVPKKAPHRDESLAILGDWLSPEVQKKWSNFLSGSSANPNVPWTNPPSRRIQKIVADEKLTVLNRYYENSPPALVQGNLQDLGGFMADPSSPNAVLESMQRRGDTEWQYWKEETRA